MGEAVQRVLPAYVFELPVEDLSALEAADRERRLQDRIREEGEKRFDLEGTEGLLRVRLLKLSEQEHALLLTLHHIVSDGWSRGILIRELSALYAGNRAEARSAVAGIAGAVRGLCAVAAGVVAGIGAAESAGVLA